MTPIGTLLFSGIVAYAVLAAIRSNFMKGRNSSKKQTDVVLLLVLTLIFWSLIPLGHQ